MQPPSLTVTFPGIHFINVLAKRPSEPILTTALHVPLCSFSIYTKQGRWLHPGPSPCITSMTHLSSTLRFRIV